MFKLVGTVQNYNWGNIGLNSLVGRIANKNLSLLSREQTPYAEYWLGTHKNGDAFLEKYNINLSDYIEQNPHSLGNNEYTELPFLFKILSIAKPLSIQIHPNKAMAEYLHETNPNIYKDDNHKPEMAIALTDFELLYGFRPLSEILGFLQEIPEFRGILHKTMYNAFVEFCDKYKDGMSNDDIHSVLHDFMDSYMNCSKQILDFNIKKYIDRLVYRRTLNELELLVLKLYKHYNCDIGIFMPYIFNYVKLKRNQAIYIGAGEPHSYISGDCIECMACSDNVIRGGLTHKYIDCSSFVSMLSYKVSKPNIIVPTVKLSKSNCINIDNTTLIYNSPTPEFKLAHILLGRNRFYNFHKCNSPTIMYIENGFGYILCDGIYHEVNGYDSFFIEANKDVKIITDNNLLSIYYSTYNE